MNLSLFDINETKVTKHIWLYLSLIFTINIIIKIYQIDFSPFWYDEIISLKSAWQDFGHIKHVSEWDNNPPFYYYCLSVWIKLFGDTEFTVRLLSAIFSSLIGVLIFQFSNKYFNRITAVIASCLYVANDFSFYFAHEARAYALVTLLGLTSSLFYFSMYHTQSKKTVVFLGLFNFLIVYTHYIAGLILGFQFILMLVFFNKESKKNYLCSVLITLGLVFLRFTKKQFLLILGFNSPKNNFWLKTSDFIEVKHTIIQILYNPFLIGLFVITVLLLVAITIKLKDRVHGFYLSYLCLLSIGSVVGLYFLGQFTPIFLNRYLLFTLPYFLIILSLGISCFKYSLYVVPVFIVFSMIMITRIDFKTDKNMDMKGVVSFVKAARKTDDLIIVKTNDVKSLFCYYYQPNYLKDKKEELDNEPNIIFCTNWSDVNKDVALYKRVFVIDVFSEYNPNETEFKTKLALIKHYQSHSDYYKGIKLYTYK